MKSVAQGDADLTVRLDDAGQDEVADIFSYNVQLSEIPAQVTTTANHTHSDVSDQQIQIEQVATAMNEMTAQIASASEEQSAVAEEINRHIVVISDLARNTVVASNKSSDVGEEMTGLVADLSTIVKQFKI